MTLVVDIRHWLDESGCLPTDNLRLRRAAMRIATLIEYGGTLEQFEGRETMVPCKRRPGGKPCLGLLMVMKLADDRIQAHCSACSSIEAVISGWQETDWAEGQCPAVRMVDD